MRGIVPDYNIRKVQSLGQTLDLLSSTKDKFKPMAGGTDLMVVFESGKLSHQQYLDISSLNELKKISKKKRAIEIGALVTYSQIIANEEIQKCFPMLVQAARLTGAVAIQNRGTIGGNIMNASPAADTPPALLCYGAQVELKSKRGSRTIDYRNFHLEYKKTAAREDELLTKIIIPICARRTSHYYQKVGTRKSQAISKVCFAGFASTSSKNELNIQIALGSIAGVPLSCTQTSILLSKTKRAAELDSLAIRETFSLEIAPRSDIRSTEKYRRQVALNLLEEFIKKLKSDVFKSRS